jgi:hypothetical protein
MLLALSASDPLFLFARHANCQKKKGFVEAGLIVTRNISPPAITGHPTPSALWMAHNQVAATLLPSSCASTSKWGANDRPCQLQELAERKWCMGFPLRLAEPRADAHDPRPTGREQYRMPLILGILRWRCH